MRELLGRRRRGGAPLLYALLDDGLVTPGEMIEEAQALVAGGVDIVQLRCKHMEDSELYRLAKSVHEVLRRGGVPLVLNDRVDVALAAGVDGVHLGATDLAAEEARRVLGPRFCIGVTAHDPLEVAEVGPETDYLGCGAVFPTSTRASSAVCGPTALTRLAAGTSLPMIAIGGLGPENVEALRASPIAGVAVGAAISPAREKGEALATLRRVLESWAGAKSASNAPSSPHETT